MQRHLLGRFFLCSVCRNALMASGSQDKPEKVLWRITHQAVSSLCQREDSSHSPPRVWVINVDRVIRLPITLAALISTATPRLLQPTWLFKGASNLMRCPHGSECCFPVDGTRF